MIKAPINRASIRILNTQHTAISGEQGKFLIENISHGNYIINVSSIGYASINRQINMGDGLSGIEIVLQPSFKQLSEVIISTEKEMNCSRKQSDYGIWKVVISIRISDCHYSSWRKFS